MCDSRQVHKIHNSVFLSMYGQEQGALCDTLDKFTRSIIQCSYLCMSRSKEHYVRL